MSPLTEPEVPWALVTGGAGFIGSHLCELLVTAGYGVICVDDFCTGSEHNLAGLRDSSRFRLVVADITEPSVTRRLGIVEPLRYVFHLASPASPVHYLRMPLRTLRAGSVGTENMLALATEKDARFLLASTSEVYGDPLRHPQTESYWGNVNPVGPRAVYDEAKRYAEAITATYRRSFGTNTTIARLFNSYGPRMRTDDGRVVPSFITQALAGQPLSVHGNGKQTRSLCYVDDTVAGLLALAESELAGPVNLGNDEEMTVLEVGELVTKLVGCEPGVVFRELPEDDPGRRCPDISLAQSRLSWSPKVTPHEGLRRTVEWFRAHSSIRHGEGTTQ